MAYVRSVNLNDRLAELSDGTMLQIASIHDADGEEVDDLEDATFITLQLECGGWTYALLSEYEAVSYQ